MPQGNNRLRKRRSFSSFSPGKPNMKKTRPSHRKQLAKPPASLQLPAKSTDSAEPSNTPPMTQSQASQQHPQMDVTNTQQDPVNLTKKVKPIFMETNCNVVLRLVNDTLVSKKPMIRIIRSNKMQIQCSTAADKKVFIAKLEQQKHKFYTFTEPEDKSSIFILKGHHEIANDELCSAMQAEGIPAQKVTLLSENQGRPIFLVHFKRGEMNIAQLSHQHKSIGQLLIKWELLDKNRKRPTQCHNCQEWGHSARNCGRSYRCIKCTDGHGPGLCQRTIRDGNPTCCNCKQAHPANSRQCQAFLDYQQRTARHQVKQPAVFTSTPAPWNNAKEFPSLPSQQHQQFENHKVSFIPSPISSSVRPSSRAAKASQAQAPQANNFNDLQSKFASIKHIDITLKLFNELIEKLEATTDHGKRMLTMMQYCAPQNAP